MTLFPLCIKRSVGRSVIQSNGQTVSQPVGLSVGRLVDRSVSQSSSYSVIRSIGQSASQCEKIVVLASKFRFLEFLVLKTCRLKACACTCTGSGSAAIEIDSARKPLWHVLVYTSHSFCNASLSYLRQFHSPRKSITTFIVESLGPARSRSNRVPQKCFRAILGWRNVTNDFVAQLVKGCPSLHFLYTFKCIFRIKFLHA